MAKYIARRIDEKGTSHWLEGVQGDSAAEAWDRASAILGDWLKLHTGRRSQLLLEEMTGQASWKQRPPEPDPVPDITPHDPDQEERFGFDENTPAHAITGALTPAQKAAVLVELLRGLQVNSVVGCLDLAADENPLILKLWMVQLEVLVRNKQMHHDEITVRSILGNPRD